MNKLTLEHIAQEPKVNFFEIEKTSFVDVSKTIDRPPVALSIGVYPYKEHYYPITFGSYGNFSCIVGASKSMKTFIKTAMVSAYIGGNSENYFPDMRGHETVGKYVIDIDTEQGIYHAFRSAKRVCEMVGDNYSLYRPYGIRPYDPKTRFDFIDWIFNESPYRNNIGLVTIDGAADLVDNVNDLEASNRVVNSLLRWTQESNCHLITVLHRNFGGSKPTGHLGSAILKKAETVAFVDREEDRVKVAPEYTRNYPFNEFYFELNGDFLPIDSSTKNDVF